MRCVPYADTVLGGRYKIKRQHQIKSAAGPPRPSVWGETAEVFNPDNFAPEREAALPPNAYKPFGNGQRACIGRQFALQEATLVIGMILQRFKLIDHTRYELKIKETLTMKPDGFKIRVRLRRETERAVLKKDAEALRLSEAEISLKTEARTRKTERHETPLLALYGSNMGTARTRPPHRRTPKRTVPPSKSRRS